jgi:hypothetical protein
MATTYPKQNLDFASNSFASKQLNDIMKKIFKSNSGNYVDAISNTPQIISNKDNSKLELHSRKVGEAAERKEDVQKTDRPFVFASTANEESQRGKHTNETQLFGQNLFSNVFGSHNKKSSINGTEANKPSPLFANIPQITENRSPFENETADQKTYGSPKMSGKSDAFANNSNMCPSKLQTNRDNSPAKDIRNATQIVSEVMLKKFISKSTP